MSLTLSSLASMHFPGAQIRSAIIERDHPKNIPDVNYDKDKIQANNLKMNLQTTVKDREPNMDDDQNSCGTSISNSLDTAIDSDLENDHPSLVPEERSMNNDDILRNNNQTIASMFQPAHDIVKKEFPLEFGFGGRKPKRDFSEELLQSCNYPTTSTRPPFLLPAQLYKNFFASFGKRERTTADADCPAAGFQVYPRNMLFSTGNRNPAGFIFSNSDDENCDRSDSPLDEVF